MLEMRFPLEWSDEVRALHEQLRRGDFEPLAPVPREIATRDRARDAE